MGLFTVLALATPRSEIIQAQVLSLVLLFGTPRGARRATESGSTFTRIDAGCKVRWVLIVDDDDQALYLSDTGGTEHVAIVDSADEPGLFFLNSDGPELAVLAASPAGRPAAASPGRMLLRRGIDQADRYPGAGQVSPSDLLDAEGHELWP